MLHTFNTFSPEIRLRPDHSPLLSPGTSAQTPVHHEQRDVQDRGTGVVYPEWYRVVYTRVYTGVYIGWVVYTRV